MQQPTHAVQHAAAAHRQRSSCNCLMGERCPSDHKLLPSSTQLCELARLLQPSRAAALPCCTQAGSSAEDSRAQLCKLVRPLRGRVYRIDEGSPHARLLKLVHAGNGGACRGNQAATPHCERCRKQAIRPDACSVNASVHQTNEGFTLDLPAGEVTMSLRAPGCLPVSSTILALPSTVCKSRNTTNQYVSAVVRFAGRLRAPGVARCHSKVHAALPVLQSRPAHLCRQLLRNVARQARAHACRSAETQRV